MVVNKIKDSDLKSAVAFLRTIPPFDDLTDQNFKEMSEGLFEEFYPRGSLIFIQDRTDIEALCLIKRGGVKLYLKDEENTEILKEYRGPGDYFGGLGIIMETKANLNVEAVEDTCCILLPKKSFQDLIRTDSRFSHFFLKSFCNKYIHSAHFELRKKKEGGGAEVALSLFNQDIAGVMKGSLHTCLPGDTIQAAAQKMASYRIGSLLVKDDNGNVEGIITDKDLRTKVVARGISSKEPVESIMATPVKTVPAEAVCFDALFSMLKNRIHHLAVEKEGDITGIITAHDLLLLQESSPIFLFREIVSRTEIEGLYPLAKQFPGVVRALIEQGAKASNITRMVTVLNDQILDRILSLLIQDMGTPPVPFCWLVMGSEGRKEQTLATDQDNAIMYEDPDGSTQKKEAQHYFLEFGKKAVEHLAACGYALCKGDIMASNPKWNQPFSEWQKLFDSWIFYPDPKEVLHSTIFFDFRPAFGKVEFAHQLRKHLAKRAMREKVFIHHMARNCMATRPPLSLFKNFIRIKDGKHKGLLDLKTVGLTPLVDFARLMSLDRGVTATNTLERIESLNEHKCISDEFALKVKESYEFQMQLRLMHQIDNIEDGKDPDNYINPSDLPDIDRHTLKRFFLVIGEIQSFVGDYFHLNLV